MVAGTFANALRALREQHGLSRADLATASGLSYPYVSQLETGLRKPSRKAAAELARALSIDPLQFEATIPGDAVTATTAARVRSSATALQGLVRDDLARRIVELVEQAEPRDRIDLLAEVQRQVLHGLCERED